MRRMTTTLAAALLGLGATLTATPALASSGQGTVPETSASAASVHCDVSVYTDYVDRNPQTIFGLGTVSCDSGYLPRYGVTIDLFRMTPGGTPQHLTGSNADCTTSCTLSTGQYTPAAGNSQYCTRIGYNDAGTMRYHWSGGTQCQWR